MPEVTVTAHSGTAVTPFNTALAELRIQVFREWPYLYEGTLAYEQHYLDKYATCPQSIVAIAKDGKRIVGATTGLPLAAADSDFQKPFLKGPYPIKDVFYLGESVLLPEYRGKGIGHQFFEAREAQAVSCGYKYAAFCAVDRAEDDPRRPSVYTTLDSFWHKRRYIKHPELQATFDWREVGQSLESSHTLSFWIKKLEPSQP
ncbi:MAG: GNAT family N-acetyltransferase [Opitutaceae bacterium]